MVKHGLYNLSGAGIRVGLAIVVVPILIRLMGIDQYGLWSLATATVGFLALADGGFSISVTVFLSKELATGDNAAAAKTLMIVLIISLVLATGASAALWLGASQASKLFSALGGNEHRVLAKALQVGGILVWSRILQSVLIGVEQAYRRYGAANLLIILQSVLANLGMIPVAWRGGRVVALMEWQAVATLAVLMTHVYLAFTLVRTLWPQMTWDRHKAMYIARYSSLTWLSNLGSVLFGYADRLMVGGISGTNTLGVYAAITSITAQINGMSGAAVQPFLPSASRLVARKSGSDSELRVGMKQAFQVNALVALGMGVALFVLAQQVLQIIIPGADNPVNLFALRLAIIIYALFSMNAVGYYTLFSVERVMHSTVVVLVSAIVSVLVIGWGARTSGLIGAVAGNAVYLGTLVLDVLAVRAVGVSGLWVGWLVFPTAWFLVGLALGISGPSGFLWRCVLLICHSAFLLVWFAKVNKGTQRLFAHGD